jgi:hypothetical protein
MIISLISSSKQNKRFKAVFDDGKEIDFGLKGGKTYIDHKDRDKKINYWRRHWANKTERKLIKNLIPSPALLSAMILWGPSPDLDKNIDYLNQLFRLSRTLRAEH